ncbi:MAG TPA: phage major capsid protein [Fimbriimonas sp.]|nr:phage major capsid protein [Fimbriimonas sp.]
MNKKERLNQILAQAKALSEKTDRTAEETETYKSLIAEGNTLKQQLSEETEMSRSLADLNDFNNLPANQIPKGLTIESKAGTALITESKDGREETIEFDFGGLSQKQHKAIRETVYRKSFMALLRGVADTADFKVLSEGRDPDGGYLVPAQMETEILKRESQEPMFYDAVGKSTTSSDKVTFPTRPYSGDGIKETPYGISYTGELGTSVTQPDKTFGEKSVEIYTGSFIVEMSKDLLEDTGNTLVTEIRDEAMEAYLLGMEYYISRGTGVGCPKGIHTNLATSGEISVDNIGSSIAASMMSEIVKFNGKLPKQYRANSRYFSSETTFHELCAVKDGNNNLINQFGRVSTQEGMAGAYTPRILGKPIDTAPYMDDPASNSILLLHGNFQRGYRFIMRSGLVVTPYGEADKAMLTANKVGFHFKFRNGGDVIRPWMFRAAKQA